MSEKIHVLHVVGRMDRGGTESLLMNLLRTVDKERFQFDFVEQTTDECDHDKEILSLGSTIYRSPHISIKNLKEYRNWWKRFFEEHPEYEIVHGHSRGSAPIYLDEAKKAGRKTILHCHNNSHGKGIKGAIRFLWQLPLRHKADYNFACSYESGISQFGKNNKFDVIKNGIQTEKYLWNENKRNEIREEYQIGDAFLVGNVARFEEQKNHKYLVKIFYEIHKLYPNSKLMLVGKGSLEGEIRQLVKELHLEDDVIFTGVKENVNELLQAMDIFVLSSFFEGLPLVSIEVQSAGLPCFASKKAIPEEAVITNLVHYISLEQSPGEWAKKIVEVYLQKEERINRYNEIVQAGFDINTSLKWLCDFYERIN